MCFWILPKVMWCRFTSILGLWKIPVIRIKIQYKYVTTWHIFSLFSWAKTDVTSNTPELQILVHSMTKIAHLLRVEFKTVKAPPMFYRVERVLYFIWELTITEHEFCLNMLPVNSDIGAMWAQNSFLGGDAMSLLVGQEKNIWNAFWHTKPHSWDS